MRTSFERVRKYRSLIGKIVTALVLAALIGGISTAWADPRDGRGYKKHTYKRYEKQRHYYDYGPHYYGPHYGPRRVYVPPPVYYAPPPPPPPPGIEIFLPPIVIR